jgi:hypothetical protein
VAKSDLTMEFVIRLKRGGFKTAEYIFRQPFSEACSVECVNYWPSGGIHDYGTISLEAFITGMEKIRQEKTDG